MEKNYPSSTKVVVIGGGVIGCSVAYHLTKFGWKDVILLERDQLTSGTTWHAAGLVSQLGPTAAVTKIRKYTLDLYKKLEKEVDHSAGLRINGALSIAQTDARSWRPICHHHGRWTSSNLRCKWGHIVRPCGQGWRCVVGSCTGSHLQTRAHRTGCI